MAAVATVLAALLAGINIGLALRTVWKDWRHPSRPHPLEPAVRDIAAAIRERGPDFHLVLDKEKPA